MPDLRHTPAPWDYDGVQYITGRRNGLPVVIARVNGPQDGETRANGGVLGASPDHYDVSLDVLGLAESIERLPLSEWWKRFELLAGKARAAVNKTHELPHPERDGEAPA